MKTLFINTVTFSAAVAIYEKNMVIAQHSWQSHKNEAEQLQPAVKSLLKQTKLTPQDIQRLVVCIGPGGFTSTRIGVSTANIFAFTQKIPIAPITVFDLYGDIDALIVVSANAYESWIKFPFSQPEYFHRQKFQFSKKRFLFTGMLHPTWKNYLEKHGGVFHKTKKEFPSIDKFYFQHALVKSWYYKEAHITWSKKNTIDTL